MASISKTVVNVFFLSLALCRVAAAQSSSTKDIVQGIEDVTKSSGDLRKVTEEISEDTSEVTSRLVLQGLNLIRQKVAYVVSVSNDAESEDPGLSNDDQKHVEGSLTNFVKAQEVLMRAFINKVDLILFSFYGTHISETLEGVKDSELDLERALKNITSPQESAAEKQVKILSKSVTEAADFQQLTQQSYDLFVATFKIIKPNAARDGNVIPQGLGGISNKISEASGHLTGGDPGLDRLNKDDAKLVVESLSEFVQAQEEVLIEVIEKHKLSNLSRYFDYILQALELLDSSLDDLAVNLIALIPIA